jgi:uroporphyrinogen decarboxylase
MNSRERVIKTIKHQLPDRIPLDGWFLESVFDNLKKYLEVNTIEDVLKRLSIDLRTTCMEPEESIKKDFSYFKKMGLSIPIDDYYVKRVNDYEYEDEWGVKIAISGDKDLDWKYSYHPLNINGKLAFDNLKIPDISNSKRFEKIKADVKRYGNEYAVAAGVSTLFRKSWILCGFSRFLEALYTDRIFIEQLLDKLEEFYMKLVKIYIDLGVDIIEFGGDLGTEQSLMISPQLWREIFKPRLKKIIKANKKEGVYFYLHSDGNIISILPDLIEIGFDILNPIQPECMDPKMIKEKYGKSLTLHGTMSLQKTFALGSKRDLENEILDRIKNCGQYGGLILSPSNAFTIDVQIENIIFFYDFVSKYKL